MRCTSAFMGSRSAMARRMDSSRVASASRSPAGTTFAFSTLASHCATILSEVSRSVAMFSALSSAVKQRLAAVWVTRM